MRSATKKRAGRDPGFLVFIREQPCHVCVHLKIAQRSRTEAAHVGDRGLSQKCPDREAIPLCGDLHHRLGGSSAHVLGKHFWKFYAIERAAVIKQCQDAFHASGHYFIEELKADLDEWPRLGPVPLIEEENEVIS